MKHALATKPRTAPLNPRRVSGPARRPVPVGPPLRQRTSAFERLSRLPDHRVVDRLLRGRACIWVVGLMLGGIVAMQVSLLKLNAGISRAVQTQSTLERQNATLQASIAAQTSGDRIREDAAARSMVDPQAGETKYLRARPATDPARAVRRMRPASAEAAKVMANNGLVPAAIVPAATTTTTTPTTTTTTVAPTATAVATPPPAVTPTPTVAPVATPMAAPGTGAATAPTG